MPFRRSETVDSIGRQNLRSHIATRRPPRPEEVGRTRQRPDASGLRMLLALALRQLRMIDLSTLRLITPRAPVPCAS